jgi:hypothetical protein
MDFFVVHLDLPSPDPVRVQAVCNSRSYHAQPVDDWWKRETSFSYDGTAYTRSDVVLAMANKDGGAHVDAVLRSFYESLMKHEEGLSIVTEFERLGAAPFENGVPRYARNSHLALMRQLAHEVLSTASHQGWPVDDRSIIPWMQYPGPGAGQMTPNTPG